MGDPSRHSHQVSTNLNDEQFEALKSAAKAGGMTVAVLLRKLIRDHLRETG